mmetsp:Transcript_10414/g.33288  ORF Transcript_10414/g.33288 Transcript_10414/m.33288 type:complete len:317 (-) Transcript_10414:159-1109(-)
MASVNVTNISVLNNPGSFTDGFQFEITFECRKELTADLEWKLTYVGSAESEECDQELDSVLVGPVPLGVNRFFFETPPPDPSKIPKQDLIGVTVCLISCLYKGKEFIRIGYYVNNEYDDPELQPALKGSEEGMDIDDSDSEDEEEEGEDDNEEGDAEAEDEADTDAAADAKAESASSGDKPAEGSEADSTSSEGAAGAAAGGEAAGAKRKSGAAGSAESMETDTAAAGSNKVRKVESESGDGETKRQRQPSPEEDGADGADAAAAARPEDSGTPAADGKPAEKEVFQLPANFSVDKIRRQILEESPRVTRFVIDWE